MPSSDLHIPRMFVSVIGRTIMGTLAPLLATRQHLGEPVAIHLLATSTVIESSHNLAEQLQHRFGFTMPITVWPIADSVRGNATIRHDEATNGGNVEYENVRTVISRLEASGPMVLNIQGGTNHLYAGALLQLARTDHAHILVDYDHTSVTLYNGTRYQSHTFPLPEPLPVEEILSIQGIQWEKCEGPEGQSLSDAMKQAGVGKPANALWDVQIGGMFFDLVWNDDNNVLNFLAWVRQPQAFLPQAHILQEGRAWLDFARDKRFMDFLFTRNIFLFHWDGSLCERVKIEANSKIRPYHTQVYYYIMEALKEVFAPRHKLATSPLPGIKTCPPEGTPVLVTALGTSDASLVALCAHNAVCKHALVVYTPDDAIVASRMESIIQHKEAFGYESITPVQTTIAGDDLIRRLPANLGQAACVNITPGSKGQTFGLAMWAKCNGAEVYSLEPDAAGKSQLFSYTTDQAVNFAPVPVDAHLRIMLDSPLKSYEIMDATTEPEADNLDATLRFFKSATQNGKDIDIGRFSGKLYVPGFTLSNTSGAKEWTLQWNTSPKATEKSSYSFTTEGGMWFERLTAWAFAKLPKNLSVVTNVASVRPSKVTEAGPGGHLTEVDVLAFGKGEYFAISCKLPRLNDTATAEAARQIHTVAHNYGRYFAPMLCSFYQKEVTVVEGVVCFGWRTLWNQNALIDAMKRAKALL